MKYLIPLLIAAGTLLAAVAGAAPPAESTGAIAAVFPPWWSRERSAAAVAAADGLIVREGAVGSILVVRPGDAPRLADRLHSSGAILLLGPGSLGGCLFAS